MASLGVEFGASRLLAPYFGTSLYVWGVLIGLILIYLSAGYVIGGGRAGLHVDRGQHPRHVPACLLVHPGLWHAADARRLRAGAGFDLGTRAVAAATSLCVIRGRGDHRLGAAACRDQAARGR